MKNLMTYINPSKCFGEEEGIAVKIHIDNSLDLGWKREDILLVTNFPYEYNGVRSLVVGDDNYCAFHPPASKINAIIDLFGRGIIEKGKIYWYHGFAEYQLHDITEAELELNKADMFLPDFGRVSRWSSGSIFFKESARDIFNWIKDIVYKYKTEEEAALGILTGQDSRIDIDQGYAIWAKGYNSKDIPEIENINERIKRANITYNFHSGNIRSNYPVALKPIRVTRFHFKNINPNNPHPDQIGFFLHGKNKLGVQIVPERLVRIFNKYGIK
jgi:hypothetical protein